MKPGFLATVLMILSASFSCAEQRAWQAVETGLGRNGIIQEDMIKVTFPRTDLKVKVGEVQIEPALALTTWIGFKGTEKQAMMMGDMVLLEREVLPVMEQLAKKGIEVTALHNHLLNEIPTVMYLHFSGNGDPGKLAEAMRSALSLTATPIETQQPTASRTTATDWTRVEGILGKAGQKKGNMLQLSFPRREAIQEHDMEMSPFMGMATGINIQAVGTKAATTGDFVLLGDEVNQVAKALISHNIAVTAIHSHMLHESPRLFFLHFWGYDEPEKLARGLKAALERTNSR